MIDITQYTTTELIQVGGAVLVLVLTFAAGLKLSNDKSF